MTRPSQYPSAEQVINSAVQQRERKRSGTSLRVGVISLLVLIVAGFLLMFVFGAGNPNNNSAPTCNGETMNPGDVCDKYTNGTLTGTDSYQDLLNQQHNGSPGTQAFGWILVGLAIVLAIPVYLANNPAEPWGAVVTTRTCPRCGQTTLREKRTSATNQRGRTRLTTSGIVTLCTPQCGYTAIRRPNT
jgi:hypothetical protein